MLEKTTWQIADWQHVAIIFGKCYKGSYLEAFAATEFKIIFSGREPRQGVNVLRRFRERTRRHILGAMIAPWRRRENHSLKRWRTFTPWRRCLREKIVLNYTACQRQEDEFAWASNMLDRDEECLQNFYRETSREEILETLVCRREDVIL
jgi:hypothetical protein